MYPNTLTYWECISNFGKLEQDLFDGITPSYFLQCDDPFEIKSDGVCIACTGYTYPVDDKTQCKEVTCESSYSILKDTGECEECP